MNEIADFLVLMIIGSIAFLLFAVSISFIYLAYKYVTED
jgi:hypothetical protein